MAKQSKGKISNPINVNMIIIEPTLSTTPFSPQVIAKYEANSEVPMLTAGDSFFFMDNLSQALELIPLPTPTNMGNAIFRTNTNTDLICLECAETSPSTIITPVVITPVKCQYIDGGKHYDGLGAISETKNFGWQPVSNHTTFTVIERSDVTWFDYPEFAVRGFRKIPTSSAETLCGPYSYVGNTYSFDRMNYNWMFGNNIGIDFTPIESGATPVAVTGSVVTQEGCASISNEDGELLFYTNGETVYTKNGDIMVGGTGLSSSGTSTQSCIIVPRPSTNKYFIFTTDFEGSPNGFEYSIVDMTAQNGEGEVEISNITLINDPVSEKVTACSHGNEINYWVIAHTSGDSRFHTYQITPAGINPPVISNVGTPHLTSRGYMKTSRNCEKLVSLLYDEDIIEVFDFDSTGGTITNPISLTGVTFDVGPYGLEFSPDSTKFYVSDGAGEKIYQFDLTYTAATDMTDNMIEVTQISGASLGALQMGPDEKIYVADLDKQYLHVIHNPNGLGVQCNFHAEDFYFTGFTSGHTSEWGLPNVITDKVLSCDRYVYVSARDRSNFEFEIVLNDVSDVIQPRELNFNGEIYKYNPTLQEFNDDNVYSITVPYTDLTPKPEHLMSVPISDIGEGEYIIKGYFEHPIQTLLADQLGYRRNTINTFKRGTEYGLYNPATDWYFLNMFEADTPSFYADNLPVATNPGALTVLTQFTSSDRKIYYYNSNSLPIVALNGAVLAPGLEYSASTATTQSNIELNFYPEDNQVLTLAFLQAGDPNMIFIDLYTVTAPIESGPTDGQSEGTKLYYNTDQNTYEYYMDIIPTGVPILTINGSVLGFRVEYFISITNPKRLVILNDINPNDIIQATYLPKTGIFGALPSSKPVISWTISHEPTENYSGVFTVEVADSEDTDFENILYFASTDHVIGERSYSLEIDLYNAVAGDKFLYRIRNEKRYTPIMGEIITSVKYSEAIPIEITTNIELNY